MRGFWRLLYFCGLTSFSQSAHLRAWLGIDPGELVSGAGGLIRRFHIRRQRTRIGQRHGLINVGLEIGRLFDQDRRKLRVFG